MSWTAFLGGMVGALVYQGVKMVIEGWRERRKAARAEAARVAEEKFWR